MSNILLLPKVSQGPGDLAKAVNRVVKNFRGKSRPFLMILVEDSGDATVVSNMDVGSQRVRLLEQVAQRLKQGS